MVQIQGQTTALTLKGSLPEGEVLLVTTSTARTGGSLKAGKENHCLAPLERDPFQDVHELRESQVADLAPPQAFHGGKVQVLHRFLRIWHCCPTHKLVICVSIG